jgi:uncharacterized protein involved in response to NO
MISKGFGLVALFASVKTTSVCIHLSCLVYIHSAVLGVPIRLFCGHKGRSLLRGLNKFISAASILRLCKAVRVQFSDPYKM